MEVELLCVALGVFVAIIGVLSLIYLLVLFRNDKSFDEAKPRDKTTRPATIMVVIGAGGHCAEMIKLMQALGNHYQPRQYVIAKTDTMSEDKVKEFESKKHCKYQIYKIPRSREVGQSYITSILSTAYSVIYSFPLVFKLRPEVILCNGPGTCIPICIAGYLLKLFCPVKIIYVESICRVESFSLSAKMLYHFVDHLIVNWPQVQSKYPKAIYLGRVL